MLSPGRTYDEIRAAFRWDIPPRYNIGADVCDRHAAARPDSVALIFEGEDGAVEQLTFRELRAQTNRLANALAAHGLTRGDRIGVLLQQCPEAAVAHIAAYKAGLVAVPLFVLFGEDALEYRLGNAGARAVVTDAANLPKVLAIRDRLPELQAIIVIDGARAGTLDYRTLLANASDAFTPADTLADDPAMIIYTSGTTGPPKGALHA
ncbi:MAG TPA: AMP-binding protein, partial [Microvirga sp.]|nr:AMP-binding protein [Microvirga sp.]